MPGHNPPNPAVDELEPAPDRVRIGGLPGGSALPSHGLIVDLFAGPGGWSEGLRMLGLHDVGIEFDEAACLTRAAAGHLTIRADVSAYPTERFIGKTWGLIASPPCQAFSTAGKGKGVDHVPELMAAVRAEDWTARPDPDPKVWLVLEPGRWIDAIRPEWIAMEQVPAVLPIWQEYVRTFTRWGYRAWTGILCAADYGVPQTRRRAVLMATTGALVWPEPTHAEDPAPDLFGPAREPWVSMAGALGWQGEVGFPRRDDLGTSPDGYRERDWRSTEEPAFALTEKARSWVVRTGANSMKHSRNVEDLVPYERSVDRPAPVIDSKAGSAWTFHQPATTIAGDPRITARCHHEEGSQGANAKTTEQVRAGDYEGTEPIKLTLAEALTLQSFTPDYPVKGTRSKQFEQVGNAVPPLLASHLIGALTGRAIDREDVHAA